MQSSLEKVRFQVFSLFRFQGTKKTKHKIAIQEERFIAYTTNNVILSERRDVKLTIKLWNYDPY